MEDSFDLVINHTKETKRGKDNVLSINNFNNNGLLPLISDKYI